MNSLDPGSGWNEHRMLVLSSLERLHDDQLATAKSLTASIEVLRADLVNFRVLELNAVQIHLQKLDLEIKMLKFQAAVIAAVFTGVIEIVSRFLFK